MNQLPDGNTTNLIPVKQPLTAGLYARVSTGRQEQEATIDSQLDEIKGRIKEDGNMLPPENIFLDDGWTGEMFQRPGLDAMRDAAQAGAFQVLYVYDRGRLSRVFAYQEIIIEELVDKEIEFVTLHDVKAETPEERVLQAMQGVFHEYERVKIVERMRRGKLYKAKLGIMINGSALYGWKYVKKTETKPAHYEINEEEAQVVRMVWELVGNERVSIREVLRRLYDMGVPTKKGKSEFWTKGPIVRILRCESYVTGFVYYNKTEAVVAKNPIKNEKYRKVKKNSRKARAREDWIPFSVPPIITDKSLYEKIQKILDNNQRYARKNRKYDYLVSDRAFCVCGNKRVGDGSSKHGHFYYRCAERIYNFPNGRKCTSEGVNAALLDALLWKELLKILTHPLMLKKHAEEWLKLQFHNNNDQGELKRLEGLISKIEDEENRYAKAYGEGALEFEQFKELVKETKKRKVVFEKRSEEIKAKNSQESVNIHIDDLLAEVKEVLKSFDLTNRIQIVKDIIDKVIIGERSGVEVWAHIALPNIQKLGHEPIGWDSWVAQRWQIYTF